MTRLADFTDAVIHAWNDFTDRHAWQVVVGMMWLCLIIASFWGCLPAQRVVTGQITRIMHDEHYEQPCGLFARIRDVNVCDAPPVCCSYWITLTDSARHREVFFAQWPRYMPGLWLGEQITGTLRRATVHGICTQYGCAYMTNTLALESDTDYTILTR